MYLGGLFALSKVKGVLHDLVSHLFFHSKIIDKRMVKLELDLSCT